VEKQLSTSTVFIINKTDLVSRDVIEKIKQVVRDNHPDPRFFETTFSDIPLDSFPFIDNTNTEEEAIDQPLLSTSSTLSPKELDEFISDMLDQPDLESTPPDQLASVAYKWIGDDFDEIRSMAKRLPSSIIRAKGFVLEKGEVNLFSYVMGDWILEDCGKKSAEIEHMNMVVFIGEVDSMDKVKEAAAKGNWSAGEVLQPMLQMNIDSLPGQ